MTDGLPTYRFGEIPDGMATMTMLARQHRRRPAPDQPAVGWYPVRGRSLVPLFAVADSVELPPMSDKQLARWTANRTCVRCEEVRAEPVPLVDGRRADLECRQAERLAAARVTWLQLRTAARAWARAFLADRDSVILVGRLIGGPGTLDSSPVELVAAGLDGMPLLDVLTWPSPHRNILSGGTRYDRLPRTVREAGKPWRRLAPGGGTVDCDDIVPYLMPLLGRPIAYATLGTDRGHPLEYVAQNSHLWTGWDGSLFAGPALSRDREGTGDIALRWRDWLCQPNLGLPWRGREGLARQPLEADDARAGIAAAFSCLVRMATDDHPDGPALCPVLPDVGLEPCGEPAGLTGTCPGHAP